MMFEEGNCTGSHICIERADELVCDTLTMITRREFIFSLATGLFAPRLVARQRDVTLRVGLLLPAIGGVNDIRDGIHLALSENERAAALFGQKLNVEEKFTHSTEAQSSATELIRDHRISVLIGGAGLSEARQLRDAADKAGIVFLNVGATDDSLRREGCTRTMYHVAASDAMIASAKQALGASQSGAAIELWHSSLDRYGGSQLNDRFRNRFARSMNSAAWAGWFALKLAWESGLRAQSAEPSALLAALDRDGTQFDGHKGAPLSFRSWDHQLRQPLYAVAAGRVVAELPDVGRNADQSMREELDKFGDPAGSAGCGVKR
jgi:ABC-type branched-subunit amino acid transport system substrate-binding protein